VRGLLERLRRTFVDSATSRSVSDHFRRARFRRLLERFPDLDQMHVIDLGGTAAFWASAPVRPQGVVMLNVSEESRIEPWLTPIVGDVCEPPSSLGREHFDLVFSNSVIEHVGGHHRRRQMAEVVRRLADHHWIQTPYRYFPIEPHWLFPGFQFLPTRLRARAGARWPLTWSGPVPLEVSIAHVLDVELLDATQLRHYFPASEIIVERVTGIPKSLVATA
jgi:hypothetical protein